LSANTGQWYREADSCYAYLSDVFSPAAEGVQPWSIPLSITEQFASSRWFTRGWTLQELLAPSSVVFYLQNWTIYGTKSFLKDEISRITGIPVRAITEPDTLSFFSVAQRISWASNRQTTRLEDISYCLLGILGVHMPLLYGEGTRAFIRLQEEVIKVGTDPTIFAWLSSAIQPIHYLLPTKTPADNWPSPLASSPKAFRNTGRTKISSRDKQYGPWSVTNYGIRIERLPMLKSTEAEPLLRAAGFPLQQNMKYAIALLGCHTVNEDDERGVQQYALALYKRDEIYYRFHRPESLMLLDFDVMFSERVTCILHFSPDRSWEVKSESPPRFIRQLPEKLHGFNISYIWGMGVDPENPAHVSQFYFKGLGYIKNKPTDIQVVNFSNDVRKEEFFVIVKVYDLVQSPWVSVFTNTSKDDLLEKCPLIYPFAPRPCVDQASASLGDGKEVLATMVRGMKDGKRACFVDVCIRDVK
jgi:hypothetical protein